MSDLTKRLRDLDDRIKAHFERGPSASIGPGTCGEAADRIDALEAALRELHAMVWGECPSLLNEDSGGSSRLDMEIRKLIGEAP